MTSAPSANLSHHILDLLAGVPTGPTEYLTSLGLCPCYDKEPMEAEYIFLSQAMRV